MAQTYRKGDLIAIKHTQLSLGTKLITKYLGPYEVAKALRNNRYVVRKAGE